MVGNLALGGFTCLNLQSIAQRNEELGNMIHSIDFSVLILGKKFVKVSCFRYLRASSNRNGQKNRKIGIHVHKK